MSDVKVETKVIVDLVRELQKQLESLNVDDEEFDNLLEKLDMIQRDLDRLDSEDLFAKITLRINNNKHIEVYSWYSQTYLDILDYECFSNKTLQQCLEEFMSNKVVLYSRLLSNFSSTLLRIVRWLYANKDKITKLYEIEQKLDEIHRKVNK